MVIIYFYHIIAHSKKRICQELKYDLEWKIANEKTVNNQQIIAKQLLIFTL